MEPQKKHDQKTKPTADLSKDIVGEHEKKTKTEPVSATQTSQKKTESKAEKFIRLGERRVNKAIKVIGYVENLGNRNTYEYTQAQAQMIIDALEKAVKGVKATFGGVERVEAMFRLQQPVA